MIFLKLRVLLFPKLDENVCDCLLIVYFQCIQTKLVMSAIHSCQLLAMCMSYTRHSLVRQGTVDLQDHYEKMRQ
jgi:hypothetical protein